MQYAGLLSMLCQKSRSAVRELDPSNDVTFLRLRSHKHEILVAPGLSAWRFVLLLIAFLPQLSVRRVFAPHMTNENNPADKEYILMVIQAPVVKPSLAPKETPKA